MLSVMVMAMLAQPPHLRALAGGNLAFSESTALVSAGWGASGDVGVQVNDALGVYFSARASTLLVVLAPSQFSGCVLAEWTSPIHLSLAAGAGWLYTYLPAFVDVKALHAHGPAFPLRVSYDFTGNSHLRVSLEAGVSRMLAPTPAVMFWGAAMMGYAWR